MLAVPDYDCEAANNLCRKIRKTAYAVLERKMIYIRIPMLALDNAIADVSVVKFRVHKSRVFLDIANNAVDLAAFEVESAKGVLEIAKRALEDIKLVVRYGIMALNYIIMYGMQSIIHVRNCGFDVTLSTRDETVFDFHCDVNAFTLGWRTVEVRINFKDVVQSIWNAAKATITSIFDAIGSQLNRRKKRELQHETVYTLQKFFKIDTKRRCFVRIIC